MLQRYFVKDREQSPLTAGISWTKRQAKITSPSGEVFFQQDNVEFPDFYSDTAVNIVASKYFKGRLDTPDRETSLVQLITRVTGTIAQWGLDDGYFNTLVEREIFEQELQYLLVRQMASFNSPVWFNVGRLNNSEGYYFDEGTRRAERIRSSQHFPQASACFILDVQDSMESILDWYKKEGMIFKHGSGAGINLSSLRSSQEFLSGGGQPSGPVTFMRAADINASTIKSGGKHRRAAKMVILNAEHPDILDFITAKIKEEKKAQALIDAGYNPAFNDENGAYAQVFFQNANHSVRVSSAFMTAVKDDRTYWTVSVNGKKIQELSARQVFHAIAEAAWQCADPGIQFHDMVNSWNPCLDEEEIHACNPCGEFHFLNNTACNLASINLLKFFRSSTVLQGRFDLEGFQQAVRVLVLAQDILVSRAGYPTPEIAERSFRYRPLGLGYANLGALLMRYGLPYDSSEGRDLAAGITSLMSAAAYAMSGTIAKKLGTFAGWFQNTSSMKRVLEQHQRCNEYYLSNGAPSSLDMFLLAETYWKQVSDGRVRNAQVTVLAPTGTIGFMMDCDTTGIEPELALVKEKHLVGGGSLKLVNQLVGPVLQDLGFSLQKIARIQQHVEACGSLEGADPDITESVLKIFDTSFPAGSSKRSISYQGHVDMMAAVQPFLSGAISKTVNLPESVTVKDIEDVYLRAWEKGLKCITIYRDGCKKSQPMRTPVAKKEKKAVKTMKVATISFPVAEIRNRMRLPDTRQATTHKFVLGGHEGYFTVGLYPDGNPGELFLKMAKEGSTVSGLGDVIGILVSMALQWGVPLESITSKLKGMNFEPSGFTKNPQIHYGKSIADYLARWLDHEFGEHRILNPGPVKEHEAAAEPAPYPEELLTEPDSDSWSLPPCPACGAIMQPNGSCYKCPNCGETSGCS